VSTVKSWALVLSPGRFRSQGLHGAREMASIKSVRIEDGAGKVVLRSVFDAVCPLTGLVDRYELLVEYVPGDEKLYVEAYSFQEYLEGFKNTRDYQEHITSKIARDICEAVKPERVRVVLRGVHGAVEIESETVLDCKSSAK